MKKKVKPDCDVCGNESATESACIHCTTRERSKKNASRKIQKHHWCMKCFSKCSKRSLEIKESEKMTFDQLYEEQENIIRRMMSPLLLELGISLNAPNGYWVDVGAED